LLTLTGPGGAGKTRLSLQVAADCVDQFAQGVWFVEFASLSDPNLVPQIVATTLGLHEQSGRTILDVLKDYLRDKNLLLVLDNCEHLIDACAQIADTLLRSAPRLKILATSLEPLGIGGETTYPVPSLSFPTLPPSPNQLSEQELEGLLEFEAVRLFVDRARAVQPTFTVTQANAAALIEICQRLDGIPLALELAAARVKGMTVEQIARRLDDRFRLLTSGSRTVLPRHQTLQAAVEWGYDLLSEPARVLLQRLSVFAGGWTLEAAEQVCAGDGIEQFDVMDLMMHVVDKSLVVVDQQERAARYRFLDTIRHFAREKLYASGKEQVTRIRNHHLDYFLAFAHEMDQTVRGTEQERALAALDRELDNLRAALAWAAESNNVEAELELASDLWRYWRVRSYFSEGRHWLEDALSRSEHASPSARARALLRAGSLANYQADYTHAQGLLESSLALHRELNDARGIAYSLNLLSHGKVMTGDLKDAQASLEESLTIFRELGDTRGMGYSLFFLGTMMQGNGDLTAARPLLEESLARLKEAGDKWWQGNALIQLGWGINRQGEHERALQLFNEALEISTQFGDTRGTARALLYIAEAKCNQGDYHAAQVKYREALKLSYEIGDKWWVTVCLEGLAYIAAQQNNAQRVAQLLGAAEHLHEVLGAPIQAVYRESREWSTNWAQAHLDAPAFSQAWNEGRAMTYEQAIQYALGDTPLG
ncbi:MAG TPA: tetratricopeptide repeat protein, partial [Anaerolineae bacterium]|nr:tetratricopeptide repeat protein [Anaerolineae bacterium]